MEQKEKEVFEIVVPVSWHPKFKRSFKEWLFRTPAPVFPDERIFQLKSLYVGVCGKVAELAGKMRNEIKARNDEEFALKLITENRSQLVEIVATGIQNNHKPLDRELITFIEKNFDGPLLFDTYLKVLHQMHLDAFVQCIVLMKGTVAILDPDGQRVGTLTAGSGRSVDEAIKNSRTQIDAKH